MSDLVVWGGGSQEGVTGKHNNLSKSCIPAVYLISYSMEVYNSLQPCACVCGVALYAFQVCFFLLVGRILSCNLNLTSIYKETGEKGLKGRPASLYFIGMANFLQGI